MKLKLILLLLPLVLLTGCTLDSDIWYKVNCIDTFNSYISWAEVVYEKWNMYVINWW